MLLKNKILPAVAALGLVIAVVVAVQSQQTDQPGQPLAQPARAPFKSYIGGAGIVEAETENISIGTSLAGIVKTVFVKVGDKVKAGDPLFKLDDREPRADLLIKQAAVIKARAAVTEAKASLKAGGGASYRGPCPHGLTGPMLTDKIQPRQTLKGG